jgi:hypothetical protein
MGTVHLTVERVRLDCGGQVEKQSEWRTLFARLNQPRTVGLLHGDRRNARTGHEATGPRYGRAIKGTCGREIYSLRRGYQPTTTLGRSNLTGLTVPVRIVAA